MKLHKSAGKNVRLEEKGERRRADTYSSECAREKGKGVLGGVAIKRLQKTLLG